MDKSDENARALLHHDIARLAKITPFNQIHQEHGKPDIVLMAPGFACLARIIVDQQISVSAAAAIWRRLLALLPEVTPQNFLRYGEEDLRAVGLSKQKIGYLGNLAQLLTTGQLDLEIIAQYDDEAALAALCHIKGIGLWSAQSYLLWGLGRRDICPAADIGLHTAWQNLSQESKRRKAADFAELSETWRPYRSAAALWLWHYYDCAIRKLPYQPVLTV